MGVREETDYQVIHYTEIPLDAGVGCRCGHCDPSVAAGRAETPSFRTIAAIEDDLGSLPATAPPAGALFVGSAPLAHPGFEQAVRSAKRAGVSRIGVRADGPARDTGFEAGMLLSLGVRLVEVTLTGAPASPYAGGGGAAGQDADAIARIEDVRAAADAIGVRVALRGRVPVCVHNATGLPSMVMAFAEAGVTDVALACGAGTDPGRHVEWIGAACDTGTVNRVWVSVSGVDPGLLGERAVHATDPLAMTAGETGR